MGLQTMKATKTLQTKVTAAKKDAVKASARASSLRVGARQHLDLLNRLTRIFHSSLDPSVILNLTLNDTVQLLNATSGSVVLISPETGCLEIEASVGLSPKGRKLRLRMGEGVTGWVAFHGKPLRLNDVKRDPRYIPARSNVQSELAVPIERSFGSTRHSESQIIGVLNVDSTELNAFTQDDEDLLRTVSAQMSSLIQNAWLYRQSQQRAVQLDALLQLGQSFMSIETEEELLPKIAVGASKVMNAPLCAVMLLDESGQHLRWSATSAKFPVDMSGYSMPVDNSQLGTVVRRKSTITVPEIQKVEPFPFATMPHLQKLRSVLAVPLMIGEKVLGLLTIFTHQIHLFSNEDIQIARTLANQAALAIQKCILSDKLLSTEEIVRQSERLSAIGLLAAEVAHEIRNPLTVVKMLTYSLQKDIPENDPRKKDFEVLTRKMDQMNHTVEHVLGLARNSDPLFKPVHLNSIVEDLVLLVRHKLSQQQIQFKISLAEKLPQANIDRAQIEQALLNLVLNAVNAMPTGGSLELKTGSSVEDNTEYVWIEVRDSGVGMSEKQKQTIFQPFLSTTPTGTGLGMAIVNKIIKAHGGEVKIRSQKNRGTAIRILLPALA